MKSRNLKRKGRVPGKRRKSESRANPELESHNDKQTSLALSSESNQWETGRTVFTAKELFEMDIENFPYLVEGLIPEVGLTAVIGGSAVGKSSFLRQLAVEVATGKESFLDYKINYPGSHVLYVSTEDEEYATSNSLIKAFGQLDHPDLQKLVFDFEGGPDTLKRIEGHLKQSKGLMKLVIVDAYSDVLGGDSNKFEKVRQFLDGYKHLSSIYKCSFIFLHHVGKNKENKPPSKGSTLGSQGFEAKIRMLIDLRKDQIAPINRHLCILKANMLPDIDERSHKLHFQNMYFTNTGERVPFNSLVYNIQEFPWLDEALTMKGEGKTFDQIKIALFEKGYNVSRTAIAKKVKEASEILKEQN